MADWAQLVSRISLKSTLFGFYLLFYRYSWPLVSRPLCYIIFFAAWSFWSRDWPNCNPKIQYLNWIDI